jgi:hypothetical protein
VPATFLTVANPSHQSVVYIFLCFVLSTVKRNAMLVFFGLKRTYKQCFIYDCISYLVADYMMNKVRILLIKLILGLGGKISYTLVPIIALCTHHSWMKVDLL